MAPQTESAFTSSFSESGALSECIRQHWDSIANQPNPTRPDLSPTPDRLQPSPDATCAFPHSRPTVLPALKRTHLVWFVSKSSAATEAWVDTFAGSGGLWN